MNIAIEHAWRTHTKGRPITAEQCDPQWWKGALAADETATWTLATLQALAERAYEKRLAERGAKDVPAKTEPKIKKKKAKDEPDFVKTKRKNEDGDEEDEEDDEDLDVEDIERDELAARAATMASVFSGVKVPRPSVPRRAVAGRAKAADPDAPGPMSSAADFAALSCGVATAAQRRAFNAVRIEPPQFAAASESADVPLASLAPKRRSA
jgi:hypothetical protein